MSAKFSADEDERLIDQVEQNTLLYCVADPDYNKSNMRSAKWSTIGETMGKSGK